MITSNTARVLGLSTKGVLAPGADADITILDSESLEVVHVLARGRRLIHDGQLTTREHAMDESNRRLELHGVQG